MNRSELQRLSNARIREARILFRANEYSGAYYLAGYAVECALKACYAKTVKRHDFPDKKARVFTHNLTDLVDLAGLKTEFTAAREARPKLFSGWNVVGKWSEESRYLFFSKEKAEELLDTISRRKDGVLPWFRQRW